MNLREALQHHQRQLWAIAYRMTGSASDADDVVQEVWVRGLARPPRDLGAPLGGWLRTVALNVARDTLRRRRRRPYDGPWLPTPIEDSAALVPDDLPDAEARYSLHESATFAFLLALEALSPRERAALLLADVLDADTAEVARALKVTRSNAKVIVHRARKKMAAYDKHRCVPTAERVEATSTALMRFLTAAQSGDIAELVAVLADDVRFTADSGGRVVGARKVVVGRDAVAKLQMGLLAKGGNVIAVTFTNVNGLPAIVAAVAPPTARHPRLTCVLVDLDEQGRIGEVRYVLHPDKLTRVTDPARSALTIVGGD